MKMGKPDQTCDKCKKSIEVGAEVCYGGSFYTHEACSYSAAKTARRTEYTHSARLAQGRAYNNLYNEGGEGFVPDRLR